MELPPEIGPFGSWQSACLGVDTAKPSQLLSHPRCRTHPLYPCRSRLRPSARVSCASVSSCWAACCWASPLLGALAPADDVATTEIQDRKRAIIRNRVMALFFCFDLGLPAFRFALTEETTMPAHADRKRPGGPSTPNGRGTRRGAAARLNAQLERRLATRTSDALAPMVDLDRRAAGHEEPQRSAGPGYGHGV